MISVKDKVFRLDTPATTYLFDVTEQGYLRQLYYGSSIGELSDVSFLQDKQGTGQGTAIAADGIFLDNTRLECSSCGRGDYRESMAIIADPSGNVVNEFTFDGYEICDDYRPEGLPDVDGIESVLAVRMADKAKNVVLTLRYVTLKDSDVILRNVTVANNEENVMKVLRAMSLQLDLTDDGYRLQTLDGAWARERQIEVNRLACGVTKIDSKSGVSGNKHNPYVVLKSADCGLDHGKAYGFNLMYSGNHAEIFERTPLGKVRAMCGINDSGFCWTLRCGESFVTPLAAMCFSDGGENLLTERFHKFVNEHVVPEYWRYRDRPILVNNWEATYFNFTEAKLLALAKKAKSAGAELFVLDDGWFGKRTSDKRGLGDWTENKSRLPGGLKSLANKINKIGLDFGVWVEPEMVNPDSDLYRAHPDWAISHPAYEPRLCRNQLVLDLSKTEVQDYIIQAMSRVFSSANVAYVKWDFNRPLTDWYSNALGSRQGEMLHRYTLGFYRILAELTAKFPQILFEGCASGGNRFDLGVLRYMPQIWCSDNTDSFDRVKIGEGTLTGYPQSAMGSHVSASPNHQTLRNSTIDNRFNTACLGAFGYELDLTQLNKADFASIKAQIEWYKTYRHTLQFGTYYKLRSVFDGDKASWVVVSEDKTQAVVNLTNTVSQTVPSQETLFVPHLDENATYKAENRVQAFSLKAFGGLINAVSPVKLNEEGKLVDIAAALFPLKSEYVCYTLKGDVLAKCGIKLNQEWGSTGYNGETRVMFDFGSRLYVFNKVDETKGK